LLSYLLEYFDETSGKALKVRWNGVCLVGFDLNEYPNIAALDEIQKEELAKVVERWHETVGNRVNEFEIMDVNIDLFCIPVPSVADLRACVLKRIGVM
jgi:hypothetical protein